MMAVDLAQRWRDSAPVLWAIAGALLLGWLVLVAVGAFVTEPRRVRAGAATLDLGGRETPAVVNLITNDWDLGHEAVPATLLDLAARRHISIDHLGERTLIKPRPARAAAATDPLTGYERMVLEHVERLAGHTPDGLVPAEALTTGPDNASKGWWKRFHADVIADARRTGVSKARWPAQVKTVLVALALIVALAVGVATTSTQALTVSQKTGEDDPAGAGIAFGFITALVLIGGTTRLRGERDTPAGRDAAARWLGLREHLGHDLVFQEQPPAAVAIWDRHLAHGAALGVAHAAVRMLPLGSESDRKAWSPVGGRWRLVKIRYPNVLPPGYGRHPAFVALLGAGIALVGRYTWPIASSAARSLRDLIAQNNSTQSVPAVAQLAIGIALAVFFAIGAGFATVGVTMVVCGVGDLVRGRRTITGRVLRVRDRGDENRRYWHCAVDDGSADVVRAWRIKGSSTVGQGADIQAQVSRWLGHVKDLTGAPPGQR